MGKNKKISIRDIAELAGVSVSTVSRILNQTGRYSSETEKHVLNIVKEYGYTTNYAAKTLRNSQTKTIGLIIPDITNEFFSRIAYFCQTYLYSKGYILLICNTQNDEDMEYSYLHEFASKNVDGIIAISFLTKIPKSLKANAIPLLTLDRQAQTDDNIPFVISDKTEGAYQAVSLLINNGCKNIISINPKATSLTSYENEERVLGFKSAMLSHKMFFSENDSVHFISASEYGSNEAENYMYDLLNTGKKIDGVFCGSDKIALGVSYACKHFNLSIPKDIKIIGFDNTIYSQLAHPSLSTVDRNCKVLSIKACDMILDMINTSTLMGAHSTLVPTRIIERESTRQC